MRPFDRGKISILNAVTAVALTLANGLLGIIVMRFVLEAYGSDFNGLNSTANQIVNVLMIIEGGFTLASNVALFAPLTKSDIKLVNGILCATRKRFHLIGAIFFGAGIVASIGYSFVVNSSLSQELVITIMVMAVVPPAFNLFFASTYRVLLQAQQKEYVISIISIITVSLGHLTNIFIVLAGCPMWSVRFVTMICALANSLIIVLYVRRHNTFIDLSEEARMDEIKGTADVMAQRITGVVYNSAPIVFLSVSPVGGTILASVYAVYNSVFQLVKSLLNGVIDAPRQSIGQLLAERDRQEVWNVFRQYELVAFMAIFTLVVVVAVLVLPFVVIYTDGINDANYNNPIIALLMVVIAVFEMTHIPSGHLINMAGEFKISKHFQIISCIVLLITMPIGGIVGGIYGMLASVLIVAVLLAILEIGYVHRFFFKCKMKSFFRLFLPLLIGGILAACLETQLFSNLPTGYISLFICALALFVINALLAVFISLVFNRGDVRLLFVRFKSMLHVGR